MTRYWGAAFVGLLVGLLTAFLTVAVLPTALRPSVTWVRMVPPVKDNYTSWLPCVRTSGWLLPTVTCYPTESRSQEVTLHGTGVSLPDCRLPDPAACRRAGWAGERR